VLSVTNSPYLPQGFGGTEQSTHSIAIALRKHGAEVGVMAGLRAGDWFWFRNRITSKLRGVDVYTIDKFCGYPVFRGRGVISSLLAVIHKFKPDIDSFPISRHGFR
jgi:hypothetical protein